VGNQTAFRKDEGGAIENVQGENSNDHHRFLNIWDNNLTVDESAWS
jgi:hypothetical protein